jgi:hypothetical protein
MAGIFGSSGRTANPLGQIGVVVGILGAAASVILWIHHFSPDTTILGTYSDQIVNGQMGDQLRILAMLLGTMAVVAGIAGGLGGKGSSSTVAALLLGIVGLSYPILSYLNIMSSRIGSPLN